MILQVLFNLRHLRQTLLTSTSSRMFQGWSFKSPGIGLEVIGTGSHHESRNKSFIEEEQK
jgi:hypothetical protein